MITSLQGQDAIQIHTNRYGAIFHNNGNALGWCVRITVTLVDEYFSVII